MQSWDVPSIRLAAASLAMLVLAGCTSSARPDPGPSPVTTVPVTTPPATPSSSSVVPSTRASSPSRSRRPTPSTARSSTPARTASTVHQPNGARTVVLNPGHNGGNAAHTAAINRPVPAGYGMDKACDTTGTTTDAGYPEHAFNWDVALRVRTILRGHGVRVVMTRPNDTGVGPCVDERAAIGNHADVAAVVSIHADGAPASGHGFHVNQDSRRPDGATAAVARASNQLGQAIHAALTRSSGLVPSTYIGRDGYYYRSDLAGLNLARRPATFLELGNMRNPGDAQRLSSAVGRQQIAQAVAAGILAYLGR